MSPGKSLQELGLKDEALPAQTFDDLPEFGTFQQPPQPGHYRFKLPGNLTKVFEPVDSQKGQRIRVIFDKDAPLTILQAKDPKVVGDTFQTRLTNVERKRGKDGPEVSDLDYLLKACGEKTRPTSNKAYAEALMRQVNKEFGAEITYSWQCSKDRNIRVYNADGKIEEVENHPGCERKFYQADKTNKPEQKIDRQADGTYPYEISCPCGGVVRAFANLDQIKA